MTGAKHVRVDELANAAIDGELQADAQEELARLLDEEEGQIPRFQEMLLLEGALRARAPSPNVATAVIEQLSMRQEQEQAQVLAAVMSNVRSRPFNVPPRKAPWLVRIAVAVTASVALASWAALVLESEVSRPTVGQETDRAPIELQSDKPSSLQIDRPFVPPEESTASANPSVAPTKTVFHFDFEEGVLPSVFEQGHVIETPPGLGDGYVIQGSFNAWAPKRSSILLNQRRGLFTYHPNMVLRFRYFLAAGTTDMRIQIFDINQRQNYQWSNPHPRPNGWQRIEVRLAEFYPVTDKARRLEPGDAIQNLMVIGGLITAMPLLIDDVVLASP